MDVLHVIKAEHDEIRNLLAAIPLIKAASETQKKVSALLDRVRRHHFLEHNYLYPEVAALSPGRDIVVDLCVVNSTVVKRTAEELAKLIGKTALTAPAKKKLADLTGLILRHFETEEQSLMPKIRQGISTPDREDLGQVFLDAAAELSPEELLSGKPLIRAGKADSTAKRKRA
jgi:hemerythrin-like domain-containing protein